MDKDRTLGLRLVAGGVLVLSFDALLVRLADAPALTVIFWRGLCIALSLGLWFTVKAGLRGWRRQARGGRGVILVALFFAVDTVLFVTAITHTAVANTVVILSASPLFAAMFSALFLHERLALRTWLAAALIFVGVLVVFAGSLGSGGLWGDLAALTAACTLAATFTLLRYYPQLERVPVVAASGLVSMTLVLPFAQPFGLPPESYGWLALMGLLQMPLAMVLLAVGPRYLPAPEVSLLMLLETLLGPLWVWWALGEQPPGNTVLGGLLIVGTLLAYFLAGRRFGTP
ncbi:DMT family transporter [Alkalilimnicola sp. S0819]|uniref:DMT family transporter n=1 Tax=Alkalilimnicola sp. S0819 TaxID=2613922 RepID=UPI001261F20D|nr:DMT family transporter [Alkalilimnicola sp. S0819]KAB7619645.1 DMT family transporter [Alkalilimnicola sp. S0819]MPQ17583.1 EamA family transporter [Alkalilimnicola sp. S0819]